MQNWINLDKIVRGNLVCTTPSLCADTIYTERYMGLPTKEDNEAGYNGTDVSRRVDNFRHKKYLLIHGNADDNVHYQQSMELSRALEENDILFQQQVGTRLFGNKAATTCSA